jgi:hypothetical protein
MWRAVPEGVSGAMAQTVGLLFITEYTFHTRHGHKLRLFTLPEAQFVTAGIINDGHYSLCLGYIKNEVFCFHQFAEEYRR